VSRSAKMKAIAPTAKQAKIKETAEQNNDITE